MTMAATTSGGQPASRGLVIAGFITATLFSGIVTYIVGISSATHQARLADRTAQTAKFSDVAGRFDPLVVKFVAEVREGRIKETTKAEIKANLLAQRSALEASEGLFDRSEEPIVEAYIDQLTDADHGVKNASGPLDSQAFAQAAANIADLRPEVIGALRS